MPSLREIPISRIAPSGRAATAGPSRQVRWDRVFAARGEEQAKATSGGGLQQLGAGVGAMGEKLYRQLVGDQSVASQSEYETGLQKFLVDIDNTRHIKDGIPQWGGILEQANTKHKELVEGISKNLVPEAKEAFQLYAQQRKVDFDKVLDSKIQGIRGNYIAKIFPLQMMRFARSGDTEASNNFLTQLKKYYFPESQHLALDKAFDKSTVLGAIRNRLPDEQIERMIKESDSLTQQEKTSLRNSAKIAIANRQREQQAALEAKQDETANKMLLKLWGNELTEDEIIEALENNWLDTTRAKSLRASLLDPKIPKTDYLKAYENVNEAISDFRENRKTKDEAIDVLYGNLKNISQEDGKQLLNRIYEIADPDSPMNRSDVKRWLGFLNDLESEEMRLARLDEADIEELKALRLKWTKKEDEFERWIKGQDKLTDTDIQNKIEQMTKIATEEITLDWFGKVMRAKETTPFFGRFFGTTEEMALAKKKAKAGIEKEGEIPEPKTIEEFNETVGNIEDDEKAKAYYEKWKDKW